MPGHLRPYDELAATVDTPMYIVCGVRVRACRVLGRVLGAVQHRAAPSPRVPLESNRTFEVARDASGSRCTRCTRTTSALASLFGELTDRDVTGRLSPVAARPGRHAGARGLRLVRGTHRDARLDVGDHQGFVLDVGDEGSGSRHESLVWASRACVISRRPTPHAATATTGPLGALARPPGRRRCCRCSDSPCTGTSAISAPTRARCRTPGWRRPRRRRAASSSGRCRRCSAAHRRGTSTSRPLRPEVEVARADLVGVPPAQRSTARCDRPARRRGGFSSVARSCCAPPHRRVGAGAGPGSRRCSSRSTSGPVLDDRVQRRQRRERPASGCPCRCPSTTGTPARSVRCIPPPRVGGTTRARTRDHASWSKLRARDVEVRVGERRLDDLRVPLLCLHLPRGGPRRGVVRHHDQGGHAVTLEPGDHGGHLLVDLPGRSRLAAPGRRVRGTKVSDDSVTPPAALAWKYSMLKLDA